MSTTITFCYDLIVDTNRLNCISTFLICAYLSNHDFFNNEMRFKILNFFIHYNPVKNRFVIMSAKIFSSDLACRFYVNHNHFLLRPYSLHKQFIYHIDNICIVFIGLKFLFLSLSFQLNIKTSQVNKLKMEWHFFYLKKDNKIHKSEAFK